MSILCHSRSPSGDQLCLYCSTISKILPVLSAK
ncbi:unnamed protein product [Spirodela intermedia]|uniref:Uncharacterized protein n=1 Tax=Spirodela intermedia TaxID=51605 RepID=A0A7I8KL51_SPIIN|nr:unnamed protein product [Spirodela intermedia]